MNVARSMRIVNVSSVPHRSPFRYPGGKTWLVPYARCWLRSLTPSAVELVEPFAGGASIGLTAVFENLADRATLVELDADIAAVWQTILNGHAEKLAEDVSRFEMSRGAVTALLACPPHSLYERAFATLVRNRVQRGGILAPGASLMKDGERGRGVSSRWYPETLRRRILAIAAMKRRITFVHGDGVDFLRRNAQRRDVAWFIDPPYTVAGRRLYTHSTIDHEELFQVASTLAGGFLITYDNTPEIRFLAARYRFDTTEVAMKNTHHARMAELLVGRNLDWVRAEQASPASGQFVLQIPPG
ncbi:MAG: DNA adenine methylase [Chloroflexi bacterium]|nr:DNA adenine methylase [Chloroflexota bacterium]